MGLVDTLRWTFGIGRKVNGFVYGLEGCGKTTMMQRWELGPAAEDVPPTIHGYEIADFSHGVGWRFLLLECGGRNFYTTFPLFRHYRTSNCISLFFYDCAVADPETLERAAAMLRQVLEDMTELHMRHLWIVLTKQDLLKPDDRDGAVQDVRDRLQKEVTLWPSVSVRVLDYAGLNAFSGDYADHILDDITNTLLHTGLE